MRYINKSCRDFVLACACLSLAMGAASCEKDTSIPDEEVVDLCPDDPNKTRPGICGCGIPDVLNAITGLYTCKTDIVDFCPNDPHKTAPGICGCGIADTKGPDGIALCLTQNIDLCPNDPLKTLPGICGCGVADDANDGSGIPPCLKEKFDLCPNSPDKTAPGVCGCDVPDTLDPDTGIPLCVVNSIDFCPNDPDKKKPGVCGCGVPDIDTDGDGVLDCIDACPNDPQKNDPGTCGCGTPDSPENLVDDDSDGVPNCNDACPNTPYKKDDDGCTCSEVVAALGGKMGCATMIADAKTFVALRDAWNAGDLEVSAMQAFALVNDINLGDAIADDPSKWVGWGTEEKPFSAIFIGNFHAISAATEDGSAHIQLTIGDAERDDIALFGHTQDANIREISLYLSLVGHSNVAPLAAHATKTTFSDITAVGKVTAQSNAAGIVAQAETSSFAHISSQGNVTAIDDNAACLIAQANNVQISKARALCRATGGTHAAGAVSHLSKTSKIVDLYAEATVTGNAYSSGMIAKATAHSSILNSYTMSQVTCNEAPCALVASAIDEYVTIKNVYALGNIVDNRNLSDDIAPASGPDGANSPSQKDGGDNIGDGNGSGGSNGLGDGNESNGGGGGGGETPDPDDPTKEPDKVAETPIAMIVASFGSADAVISSTYYWSDPNIVPTPEISNMPGVVEPTPFAFTRLRPYTSDMRYLLDLLNDTMICNGDYCTIDANPCISWTAGPFTLTSVAGSIMTVNVPQLRF